jgi:histidine triad (HIT) family protein
MTDTVFSKIVRGEIPVQRVYEDDWVLAFLDIAPLSDGHILVIPKEAAATMDALSDESAAAIGRVLPRLCRAVRSATGCPDYNILQNNGVAAHQAVMHVHFHIIPKTETGEGLGIGWPTQPLDPKRGAELARRICAALALEGVG